MRAGTLRERITIQRQSTTTSPQWGQSTAWNDLTSCWASVVPVEASEEFVTKGVTGQTQYAVKIRYRADITSRDRIVWRGRILDMLGIVNTDGRNRELVITAMEHRSNE